MVKKYDCYFIEFFTEKKKTIRTIDIYIHCIDTWSLTKPVLYVRMYK